MSLRSDGIMTVAAPGEFYCCFVTLLILSIFPIREMEIDGFVSFGSLTFSFFPDTVLARI